MSERKRWYLLVVCITLLALTGAGCVPPEPSSAELEKERIEAERARERLEAERAQNQLRLERRRFWLDCLETLRPVLLIAGAVVILVIAGVGAYGAYEFVGAAMVRLRQTQIKPGRELAYFPRRNGVHMPQRQVRPYAYLKPGQERAPEMADPKAQAALALAQQAVNWQAAKALEPPTVVLESKGTRARSEPAPNTQPLRVIPPDQVTPWVDDVRGQLAGGGEIIEGQLLPPGEGTRV